MRLRSLFLFIVSIGCQVAAKAQCSQFPVANATIDTFCTGTRYTFGDTILRDGGIYNRVFRDINGCDSLVSLDLRETPNVSFDISIDTIAPLCLGDSLGGIVIRNVDKAVKPIVYSLNGGPEQLSNEFLDLAPGSYQLYIRDRFGCEGRKNIQLRLGQIMGETYIDTLCAGSTYFLGTRQLTEPGLYPDTLNGRMGCDSLVILDLRVEELDNMLAGDILVIQPGCGGSKTGSLSIENIIGTDPPFRLYINDELQETNRADGLLPGIYTATVFDKNFCSLTETIELLEPDLIFELSLGEDRTIKLGETISIEIESNIELESFSWQTAPNPACLDCTVVEVTPSTSVDYILTATSIDGCTASDTVAIVVLNETSFYIPTAFSPTSMLDENRTFTVFGNPQAIESVMNFNIWDKWGNPVFNARNVLLNDLETGWDGTMDGQFVEAGVYSFRVLIRYINGDEEQVMGTVHLF